MSRLFISHSGANNTEAVAIRDWLAREGWDEVFLDLDPARVQAGADELGNGAIGIAGDVTKSAELNAAVARVASELGGLDVLINSTVAPYQPTLLHDLAIELIPQILMQQAVGPMLITRAFLPTLRAQGSGCVVNIASDAVKVPTPGETSPPCASAASTWSTRWLAAATAIRRATPAAGWTARRIRSRRWQATTMCA